MLNEDTFEKFRCFLNWAVCGCFIQLPYGRRKYLYLHNYVRTCGIRLQCESRRKLSSCTYSVSGREKENKKNKLTFRTYARLFTNGVVKLSENTLIVASIIKQNKYNYKKKQTRHEIIILRHIQH